MRVDGPAFLNDFDFAFIREETGASAHVLHHDGICLLLGRQNFARTNGLPARALTEKTQNRITVIKFIFIAAAFVAAEFDVLPVARPLLAIFDVSAAAFAGF